MSTSACAYANSDSPIWTSLKIRSTQPSRNFADREVISVDRRMKSQKCLCAREAIREILVEVEQRVLRRRSRSLQ